MGNLRLTVAGEVIRLVEGARFQGVWVDEGLRWTARIDIIDNVRSKIKQLLGVLGRASAVLGQGSLLSLYNGLVLPHLQYCLMVWGDFQGDGNGAHGAALLRQQKRFVGLIEGKRGRYHADPLFASHEILKVGDLYRQQVRVHAWRFWNRQLPVHQAAMFERVDAVHSYGTRRAGMGLYVSTRDHRSVGYKIPREWELLPAKLREISSLQAFKKNSRARFIQGYRMFICDERDCYMCNLATGEVTA